MEKKTTLRELMKMMVPEVLKEEHLLEEQQNSLVEFMLDNSHVIYEKGKLSLLYGNTLGVGIDNKDKPITLPRFMIFEFRKANPITGASHKWRLTSFDTFMEMENHLAINVDYENNRVAVVMGNEIVKFEMTPTYLASSWQIVNFPVWEENYYKLEVKQKGEVIEEFCNCKNAVELRILQLIRDGAEDIKVYCIPDDKRLYYRVLGELFSSVEDAPLKPQTATEARILWITKEEEDTGWIDISDDDSCYWDEPEF